MLLKFWGTRGSIPAPLRPDQIQQKIVDALEAAGRAKTNLTNPKAVERFVAGLSLEGGSVGGNTTCVTIELDEALIIFDAGSGIRELGEALMDETSPFAQKFGFYQGYGHAYLFFTHTHWDHIQGFPFFAPVHVPGNKFDIYHVHKYVPEVLARQMEAETNPVSFSRIADALNFRQLEAGELLELGSATVTSIELNHPGKAYAYRVEADDAIAILATDGEYTNLDHASTKQYRKFFSNADALIFDAMFSVRESFIKEDWGHSSALIGADFAKDANVKSLYLFHHDPITTDAEIMKVLQETKEYIGPNHHYPQVFVAQEGAAIELDNTSRTANFFMDDYVENGVVFISLSGKFGAQITEQFREHLTQSLHRYQADKVVLKMEHLDELTVAGIRALVDIRRNVISLALVGMPENIYRVLELAGTTDFFAIYEDDDAALTALDSNRN